MKPLELIKQGRFLGEEFLLWLWMRGLKHSGTSGVDGDSSACYVEDGIALISERAEVKDLRLSKGNPAESRAAFEALARGMRPAKAKVRIISGDMDWVLTLEVDTFALKSIALPPVNSKDPMGRLADRLFLAEEVLGHLDRRYAAFLRARVSGDLAGEFQPWVVAGCRQELEEVTP